MKPYAAYYEQEAIRRGEVASEERTPATLAMFPSEAESVLDVGCGDASLLRLLPGGITKTGIEISRTALKRAQAGHLAQGSADALPFRDRTFDCVMCTEVIEHLPGGCFTRALQEIERTAKNHILISVPFMEDLERKSARCSECGTGYHVHMHLRAFGQPDLLSLFPGMIMVETRYSGPLEVTMPSWLLRVRRKYAGRWEWDENALCPSCGHREASPPPRTALSTATSLLTTAFGKRHRKWVSVLYTRKQGGCT